MAKLMLKSFKGASLRLESVAPTIVSVERIFASNSWTNKSIIYSEEIVLTALLSLFSQPSVWKPAGS